MWMILAIIATCSVGLHVVLFHYSSITMLRKYVSEREWFETSVTVVAMGACIWVDLFALKRVIRGYNAEGLAGIVLAIVNLGPKAIGLFNEFLVDLMADIFVIGYLPGGRIGFVIGTSLSILLNAVIIYFISGWFKDKARRK